MKKTIIIITAAILSSCGVWKPYTRPEVTTDDLFGNRYYSADTTTIADLSWQDLFTDPYLQSLIAKGLEENSDLRIARLRIEQALSSLKSARSALAPSFFFAPEGALSSFDNSKATKVYSVPVTASWEIDFFGKQTNAKRRSKAAWEQSAEYERAVRSGLIATISELYYTLLMLDKQYEISSRTAAVWKESVETMSAMMQAGMSNRAAVSQYEANYYAVEASLRDVKESINRVENSLSTILFETPGPILRGEIDKQDFPESLDYGIPLQLLSGRPDVRSAELDLAQAYYATGEAKANLYPSIVLAGSAGWTNSAGSMIIDPGKLLLSAAASLTQPIFNRRMNRSQLEIARATQEQAAIRFRQTLLDAGADVNNALTRFQTAKEKRPLLKSQVASLETAVESTSLLMQYGSTTYLEILTARQALLGAEIALVANTYDHIYGIISLYRSLGGGAADTEILQETEDK